MSREKRIFAVYDPDLEFAFRFMEYAKGYPFMTMDVRAFTTEDHLLMTAQKEEIGILLISEAVLTEKVRALPVRCQVLLNEDCFAVADVESQADTQSVYKYQAPDELLRKVLDLYDADEKKYFSNRKKGTMKVIGVYSPIGRSRKTSFSIVMGQILSRSRRTLYMNLEQYAGFERFLGERYDCTLSDLLYFARQGQLDLGEKLQRIVMQIGNMDYVPPMLCPEDFISVEREEWLELFQRIEEQTSYDYLILDLGEGIQGIPDLLASCDRVFFPTRSDPMSVAKKDQFFWMLSELGRTDLQNKIREIHLPFCQLNTTGKAYFRELPQSEFGEMVREIILEEGWECKRI